MKKQLQKTSTYLLVVLLAVGALACKKDSEPGPSGVEGTWALTSITVNPAYVGQTELFAILNTQFNNCLSRTTLRVNSSGNLSGDVPSDCQAAAGAFAQFGIDLNAGWRVENNRMILTSGGQSTAFDLTVNETTMTWTGDTVISAVPGTPGSQHRATLTFTRQ
ncbi:hypothetical protein GCM10027275_06230 [Rhabdobacter roseus]|uniref:Lipocalin-like domain-containing protein n=1 Tax=Rhabdobacter roseus TaxID=1655419 RepID=A0A840TRA1_9BACT|nr:lipocalin family protein [Rhabdobacter roseus]MBB5282518.1 hypothetical protein [Rhabdobacter roseus]